MGKLITVAMVLLSGSAIAFGPGGLGCSEGGANQNQNQPGNNDEGVEVGTGSIAVDPTGTYFLTKGTRSLIYGDITTGNTRVLAELDAAERIAFANDGHTIYVTRESPEEVVAYDLNTASVDWSRPAVAQADIVSGSILSYPLITSSEDDRFVLVVSNHRLEILDSTTGDLLHDIEFEQAVRDVDLAPQGGSVFITLEETWDGDQPTATIVDISLEDGQYSTIAVPNCGAELVLTPDGQRGLLAPTFCQKDPVSVIDMETGTWIRNLPGFGPVAMGTDGITAVAFINKDNLDESLFEDGDPRPGASEDKYHLMFINTQTLSFFLLPIGDVLPRYSLTPNGKMLLVDGASYWEDGQLRIVDIPRRSIEVVDGPDVRLEEFVTTADSQHIFLLDEGLYDLHVPEKQVAVRSVGFEPTNINITPDDQLLLLRKNTGTVVIHDRSGEQPTRAIRLGGPTLADGEFAKQQDVARIRTRTPSEQPELKTPAPRHARSLESSAVPDMERTVKRNALGI